MVIKVQEKERTRIGHELHDNVNQILYTTEAVYGYNFDRHQLMKQLLRQELLNTVSAIEEIRKLSRTGGAPFERKWTG